ncbi:MAG: type 1 glutamine amidotransferase [Acidimicrobiales bacterium]|nr:type 1 glutamine amidotransferase [Acidimicrobiales bacterium]
MLCGTPTSNEFGADDRLLVGGSGAFSTLDEHPWIRAFFDYLSDVVIPQQLPTFASCFGFQSIVRAGGGQVVRDPSRAEVGTFDIEVTAAGGADPLFSAVAGGFSAQLGHKDHATGLPPGCTHLAGSERSPYQALRITGTQIVATQFHPELDRAANLYRYQRYRDAYAGSAADDDSEVVNGLLETPQATALLPRWAAEVDAESL